MKKTKLTRSLLAACSIVALSAVMYGCVHNGGDDAADSTPPVVTPTPDPGPTDLDETQEDAADAADAAMTASTNAAASAKSAMDDTMYLATLQTGDDLNSKKMGGNEHAKAASDAADEAAADYAAAKAAAAAAAAATTGEAGEAAWRMAVDAQADAEAAEAMAATHAEAASKAAMTELHINGTMKNVAKGSVDASSGELRTPTAGGGLRITGLQIGSKPARKTAASEGQEYVQDLGPATETKYKQAIKDGSLEIGKVLDTSDDKARLMLITGHQDKKTVRVFVVRGDEEEHTDAIEQTGYTPVKLLKNNKLKIGDAPLINVGTLVPKATATSIGVYYEARDRSTAREPAIVRTPGTPVTPGQAAPKTVADALDAYDRVIVSDAKHNPAKGVEIFEITLAENTAVGYARLELTSTDAEPSTTKFYQMVDIIADRSMTDGGDIDKFPDNLDVTVPLPVVEDYDHIHFGVWATLGDAEKDGSQKLADLGIGFVQNISDSGMTDRQGIGTATFNGDWVAAVRRQYASDAEAGAIALHSDTAVLTADFGMGKFTGVLTGLATLKGTLADNGFSGTTAKAIKHADLSATGTFTGSFSGGIYGPTGSEAAGVFDFDGGESGAFRGAFGGAQ